MSHCNYDNNNGKINNTSYGVLVSFMKEKCEFLHFLKKLKSTLLKYVITVKRYVKYIQRIILKEEDVVNKKMLLKKYLIII